MAKITIDCIVQNTQTLEELKKHLNDIKQQTKDMESVKKKTTLLYKAETEELKAYNKVNKATAEINQRDLTARAKQMNLEEDYTKQYEQRLLVERNALRMIEDEKKKGLTLDIESARVRSELAIRENAEMQQKIQNQQAMRRALMQSSISLFVLNISANQMLSALKPLVKGNEDYTKALTDLSSALNMTLGPMQLFMALQQISINLSHTQSKAFNSVVASAGMLYFIYAMLTTKSKELKVIYGALIGVFTALAIKTVMQTKAQWMSNTAMATGKAIAGDMSGFVKLAMGLAVAGAVAGIVAGLVSFQTLPGMMKPVRKNQIAQLHAGEVVYRPTKSGGGTQVGEVHLHFDRGTTRSDASYIASAVREAMNTGNIRKSTRAVASGG